MSVQLTDLRVTDYGPIIRAADEAVRDKSYRQTGIGAEGARYLHALQWESKEPATVAAYELVIARFAIRHSDYQSISEFCTPVGGDYIRDFLTVNWGDKMDSTKARNLSVLRGLFKWGVREGVCPWDPTATIRSPRVRNRDRVAHDRHTIRRLLAQPTLRDEVALGLLGRLALRKNELRRCQIKDIDLARGFILVHGKGRKDKLVPLVYKDLRDALYLHVQGERRGGDEYLLYPRSHRLRPMDPASVHRWFKRCLERADLPASIEIHELRHFAADELWRTTGNLILAQQLLRHESVSTTQTYLHPSLDDLAAGMRLVEASWNETS